MTVSMRLEAAQAIQATIKAAASMVQVTIKEVSAGVWTATPRRQDLTATDRVAARIVIAQTQTPRRQDLMTTDKAAAHLVDLAWVA